MTEFAGDYEWDEEEVSEAEGQIARDTFDSALIALSRDRYERNEFIFSFRLLGRLRDPHPLPHLPLVLARMPGLTADAMTYVSALGASDRTHVMAALELALRGGFHRDQEWLHLLRALTALPGPGAEATVALLGHVSAEHPHPLVRARAMLAWCRQSPPDRTDVAEEFFARERRMWKPWASWESATSPAVQSFTSAGRAKGGASLVSSRVSRPSRWAGARRSGRDAQLLCQRTCVSVSAP